MSHGTIGKEFFLIYGRRFNEDLTNDINKYFQKNGYITSIANGQCSRESSSPGWGRNKGKNI